MTRFEFLDRYKGFIPQSHATLFESDLYNTIHAEAWVERLGEEAREATLGQGVSFPR